MFAAIASAINAVRPVVVAATPYVVNAAKVSAVIGVINFGTRMTLRGGANYLRRQANEEGLDDIYAEQATNPNMGPKDYEKYASQMPGFRKTTLKEKFAFLWDVIWTSSLSSVGCFYSALTFPIYGAAWLLRYTGNIGVWTILRFARIFGMAPWTERSYNDRTQAATRHFYFVVRKPTYGVAEWLCQPFARSCLWEIQRAFYPNKIPDIFDIQEKVDEFEEFVQKAKTEEPTEKVWDSLEALQKAEQRRDTGLNRLVVTYNHLLNEMKWSDGELRAEPEKVGRAMRGYIMEHKRSQLWQTEQAVPKFLFFMGVPGPEAEKFSAEFMATGLHLSMP